MDLSFDAARGWATPIQRLNSFCGENEIWMKRDDLLPFCFGGNKARIAACYMEDMLNGGYSCMVGYGSQRSNLSRALACACFVAGVRCVIISPHEPVNDDGHAFNADMVRMFGAEFVCCEKHDVRETVAATLHRLTSEGETPYYIYGNEMGTGNKEVPTRAYSGFWNGLAAQCDICFDELYLACGTGMTMAGVISDAARTGIGCQVTGISVARIASLAEEHVQAYIDKADIDSDARNRIPFWRVWDGGLRGGYGGSDLEERAVVRSLLSHEGIPTDLTYVGKAFAGMLDLLRENEVRKKKILFLHTGGTPIFFDNCMSGELNV